MNSSCLQRLSALLAILALALPTFQQNWQSSGNMSESNITEIHNQINGQPIITTTTKAQINSIAFNISKRLNQLWDPAWNVVICKTGGLDTILYGYAFRNHWFWINGYPTKNFFLAYVIWKDYNCQQWKLISDLTTAGSGFTAAQLSQINSFKFTRLYFDVWLDAHDFVEYVNVRSTLSAGAYSVVMGMDPTNQFYGYICLVNTNFLIKNYVQRPQYSYFGSYLLFQTR